MNATGSKSQRTPKLHHHRASGQGYVQLGGRFIYLGRYDLLQTRQKYHQLVAEWIAGSCKLVAPPEEVTILEVVGRFWQHATSYYVKPDGTPTSEVYSFRAALRPLKELYGPTAAARFGPSALKAVRQRMMELGWCRKTVNKAVVRVRSVFRWATENELVPGSVYHQLQAVSGLKQGRCSARESDPVRPAAKELIDAIEPFVSRQVWAMVQLQLYTAARAGEIVQMRPQDVDRSGRIWLYRPAWHKTAHRGHERTVYIGPQGQAILASFLLRPTDACCFSPTEAEAERRTAMHMKRETPLGYGNGPGTNRADEPKRQPGHRYTAASYHRAVQYACDQAFPPPPHPARRGGELVKEWLGRLTPQEKAELGAWRKAHRWHPHQLRHNAATFLRKEFGLETARIILGHRSPAVTTIYAEADEKKAIEVMMKVG